MDAADLRMFEAVARCGGIGRAAEELHTVQSNVTARIRQLEEELGTPLFHRHARGVDLTPAGARLLPYALRMAALLKEARLAARDDGSPHGPLTVGCLESTVALRLTEPLVHFAAAHPKVDLTLKSGTSCELLDDVRNDRVEGAFVCGPVAAHDLVVEPFFREELVLFTSSKIRSLDALAREEDVRIVALRRGCSYRQKLEELLARRGVPAPRILEFATFEASFACVAAGLGVTLMPRALLQHVWVRDNVATHTLAPHEAYVETVFVRRKNGYASSALAAFLASIRASLHSAAVAAE